MNHKMVTVLKKILEDLTSGILFYYYNKCYTSFIIITNRLLHIHTHLFVYVRVCVCLCRRLQKCSYTSWATHNHIISKKV